MPPPGVEAPAPWSDPHAAPDRRENEEHHGTVSPVGSMSAAPLRTLWRWHAFWGLLTDACAVARPTAVASSVWCKLLVKCVRPYRPHGLAKKPRFPPQGPDIEVVPPADDRLRFVIDQTASYIMRDGPDFEQVPFDS